MTKIDLDKAVADLASGKIKTANITLPAPLPGAQDRVGYAHRRRLGQIAQLLDSATPLTREDREAIAKYLLTL